MKRILKRSVLLSFFVVSACNPEHKDCKKSEEKNLFKELIKIATLSKSDYDKIFSFLTSLRVGFCDETKILKCFSSEVEKYPDEEITFDDAIEISTDAVVSSLCEDLQKEHGICLSYICRDCCQTFIEYIFYSFYQSSEKNELINGFQKYIMKVIKRRKKDGLTSVNANELLNFMIDFLDKKANIGTEHTAIEFEALFHRRQPAGEAS